MELTNEQIRTQREFENLFKDPKRARGTWAKTVADRYAAPALPPIDVYDAKGQLTPESQVEKAVYAHLLSELAARDEKRLPTEGEVMEACQQYYSRHNASSYVARRDSMGAKPVDETKQQVNITNPLESLSDEELAVMEKALSEYRQSCLPEEARNEEKNPS